MLCEANNVSGYPDSYLRSLLLAELLTIMDQGHSSCCLVSMVRCRQLVWGKATSSQEQLEVYALKSLLLTYLCLLRDIQTTCRVTAVTTHTHTIRTSLSWSQK